MRNRGNETGLRGCAHQPLHRHEDNADEGWCGGMNADRWIYLTGPGTKHGVAGMRRTVVSMIRLVSRHEETACRPYCKHAVEQDHPDNQWCEPTLHGMPSRTCRTSAADSSLSQARGPTARPIARPSCVMRTVVGKPRTMNDLETSSC